MGLSRINILMAEIPMGSPVSLFMNINSCSWKSLLSGCSACVFGASWVTFVSTWSGDRFEWGLLWVFTKCRLWSTDKGAWAWGEKRDSQFKKEKSHTNSDLHGLAHACPTVSLKSSLTMLLTKAPAMDNVSMKTKLRPIQERVVMTRTMSWRNCPWSMMET